jgi:zinc protease
VPDQPGTAYTIVADAELPSASIELVKKLNVRDQRTVGAYRNQIVERLFSSLLDTRFAEMTQKPDPPFLNARASSGLFVRTKEAKSMEARVREDGIERGLDALLTEAERVARFGFTSTELDRARANVLRGIERAVAEKDTQDSSSYAAEYIRNFLQQEPIPGIVYESGLYKRFLPQITLAEINAMAKTWISDGNRVVAATAPQKAGLTTPTEAKLAAVIATAADKNLSAYVDTVSSAALIDAPPAPGTIVKTTTRDPYGITEWELSNGVKVVLKPTTFKEDEIVFRAFSPGGTSLASDADYISASTAASVVQAGGVGKLNQVDLRKVLAGKAANASAFFTETDEGLTGNGSKKDLETMFQLMYLRFTQPRPDPVVFDVLTSQSKAAMANQTATPQFAFNKELQTTLYQNHPRRQIMTPDKIDSMNLDKSMAFYKDRFADASDFTFTFVGSFDTETMKPLVEKYLASLPSTHRSETWKDVGARPITGVVKKTVEKGIEPRSDTVAIFTGPFEYNQMNRVTLVALCDVLGNRLRESLREELGGTYSVSVSPNYMKVPREEYQITINFGSSPVRVDELVQAVFKEIAALQATPPTPQHLGEVKETLLRNLETASKTNGFLLTNISSRYEYGEDLATLFNLADYYNKLTPEIIRDAARKYLNTNNYVLVELFPEKN